MSALIEALRSKYGTPQAALRALGLDESLLSKEGRMRLSRRTATAMAAALKARGMAMDVDPDQIAEILQQVEGAEEDTAPPATEPNAGMPPWFEHRREDADDEFENEEWKKDDDDAMDRRRGLDRRLGHRADDEEFLKGEEEEEFRPDDDDAVDRMPAEDRKRAEDRRRAALDRKRIRADDARRRLGRDESEEEREEREKGEEAEDRRVARDRHRRAMDYRHARDRHRSALDKLRRHADDWRRADDAHKQADDACRAATDAKNADDAKRHSEDRKRAEDRRRKVADDARRAYDEVCAARDARMRARDARRADDKRRAEDNPPPFKGMPEPGGTMVTKAAMDAAIQNALADNDARHRGVAEAYEVVRSKVGRMAMDSAIRTEGDVYGRALDVLGVPHAGITQLAALKQLFAMAPRPGGEQTRHAMATDALPTPDAHAKFKNLFGEQAASISRM